MSTDRELQRWGWESDDDHRDGGGVCGMLQEVGGVWDVCERGRVYPMKLIKLTRGARNQFYLHDAASMLGGWSREGWWRLVGGLIGGRGLFFSGVVPTGLRPCVWRGA